MSQGGKRRTGLRTGWMLLGLLGGSIGSLSGSLAQAQNLAVNGDFHGNTDGWDLEIGSQMQWTNLVEEGACAASGAGLVTSVLATGVHRAVITQCISLHDEPNLFAQVRHQGYGTFTLRLDFSTSFNCGTGFLTWANTSQVQDPLNWKTIVLSGIPPENANGVLVTLRAEDSAPHGMLVDGVIIASRGPLFLDGFEGNDDGEVAPCRWGVAP